MTRPVRPRLCRCGHGYTAHFLDADEMAEPCDSCECADFTPGKAIPKRRNPEALVRKAGAREMKLAGFRRWVVQGRYDARYGGTGNSDGIADELYLHPTTGEELWWEAKSLKGRHRAAQIEFARLRAELREKCRATGRNMPSAVYAWRSIEQVVAWLTAQGYRATVEGRVVYPSGAK